MVSAYKCVSNSIEPVALHRYEPGSVRDHTQSRSNGVGSVLVDQDGPRPVVDFDDALLLAATHRDTSMVGLRQEAGSGDRRYFSARLQTTATRIELRTVNSMITQ